MSIDPAIQEVFLEPGRVAFGGAGTRISTLLGSCVAVTFWHPGSRAGAMCHYLLPRRPRSATGGPDSRYADDAIGAILDQFRWTGVLAGQLEVKMFGGGNMFTDFPAGAALEVGEANVQEGLRLLEAAGCQVLRRDLAGVSPRMVIFDLGNGDVWVAKRPQQRPGSADGQAGQYHRWMP